MKTQTNSLTFKSSKLSSRNLNRLTRSIRMFVGRIHLTGGHWSHRELAVSCLIATPTVSRLYSPRSEENQTDVAKVAKMHKQELVEVRRSIHRHPELSFQEFHTSQLLQHSLLSKGLPVSAIVACASPGFYVDITGSAPAAPQSLCIALRAELDALAMQEENLDLPYRSEVAGVAHMCGHDGHMSILLGTAWVLLSHTKSLPSNYKVRLLFQLGEEKPPGGAEMMIKEGCLEGVDEIYALHCYNWKLGTALCRSSAMTSFSSVLNVKITGENCIFAGAEIIVEISTLIPRQISGFESAVLSICSVQTTPKSPHSAHEMALKGTIRVFSQDIFTQISSEIHKITQTVCSLYSCTVLITILEGYPPIINHSLNALYLRTAITRALGPDSLVEGSPASASEDFSRYLQRKPGAMLFLGNGNSVPHQTDFKFLEENLEFGVKIWLALLEQRFGIGINSLDIYLLGSWQCGIT